MSLSPETRDRLIANMREAYRRAVDQVQYFGASEDGIPAPMEAALAVVLDDPQVTITERTAVPPHHHEYVGGRCYRCGLASPTQWIGALDGRPSEPRERNEQR